MAKPVRRPPPPSSAPPAAAGHGGKAHAGHGGKGHPPSPPDRPSRPGGPRRHAHARDHEDDDDKDGGHKKPHHPRRHIARPPAAVLAALVLLALGGGWAGLWFHTANTLRDRMIEQLDGLKAAGWTVRYATPERSGFPLRAMLRLPALHLEAPATAGAAGGGMVEAAALTLSLLPWDLDALSLDAAAPVTLRAPAWLGGGQVEVAAARIQGRVETGPQGRLAHLALSAQGLEGRFAAGPLSVAGLTVTVEAPETRPPVALKDVSFAASAELRGVQVPDPQHTAPGPRLELASLQVRVMGPVDRDQSLTDAAQRWSNDGGTAEIDALRLVWPPLSVTAAGTLALDKSMQPVAALSSQVVGLFPLLDRMEEGGLVRPRDASVARVVLGTLARRDDNGEPVLTLPLTVQDKALSVGPARLLSVPAIVWPAGSPTPSAQVPEANNATPPPASYTVDRWGNLVPKD